MCDADNARVLTPCTIVGAWRSLVCTVAISTCGNQTNRQGVSVCADAVLSLSSFLCWNTQA